MTNNRKVVVKLKGKQKRSNRCVSKKKPKLQYRIEKDEDENNSKINIKLDEVKTNDDSRECNISNENIDDETNRKITRRRRCRIIPQVILEDSNQDSDGETETKDKKSKQVPPGIFVCKICGKTFLYKTNLYKHCRTVHKKKYENERIQCSKCVKTFTTQEKMERHLAKHEQGPKLAKNKPGIQCFWCKDMFRTYGILEKHLTSTHQQSFTLVELNFNSIDEFMRWKYDYEVKCTCKYVRRETPYKIKGGGRRYRLQCHRSGFFKSRSKGHRKLKKMGSNKIDGTCPSTILVTETEGGSVLVRNFECHEGHDFSVERLTLTPEDRAAIAGKLSVGVSENYIIESVSNPEADEHKSRLNLLNKNDIRNIRRDFGIQSPCRDKKRGPKVNKDNNKEKASPPLQLSTIDSIIEEVVSSEKAESENINGIVPLNEKNTTAEEIASIRPSDENELSEKSYTDLDTNDHDHDTVEVPERDLRFEVQTKCEMIVGLNNRNNISDTTREYVLHFLDSAIRALNNQQKMFTTSVVEKVNKAQVKSRQPQVATVHCVKKKKKSNVKDLVENKSLSENLNKTSLQNNSVKHIVQTSEPLSDIVQTAKIVSESTGQTTSCLPQSLPLARAPSLLTRMTPMIQSIGQSFNQNLPQMIRSPVIQQSPQAMRPPIVQQSSGRQQIIHQSPHLLGQSDLSQQIRLLNDPSSPLLRQQIVHPQTIGHSMLQSALQGRLSLPESDSLSIPHSTSMIQSVDHSIPQSVELSMAQSNMESSQSMSQLVKSTAHRMDLPIMRVIHPSSQADNSQAVSQSMSSIHQIDVPIMTVIQSSQEIVQTSQSISQPITSTIHHVDVPVMTVIQQSNLNDTFSRSNEFVDGGNSGFDTFVSCVLEIGGHNNASFS